MTTITQKMTIKSALGPVFFEFAKNITGPVLPKEPIRLEDPKEPEDTQGRDACQEISPSPVAEEVMGLGRGSHHSVEEIPEKYDGQEEVDDRKDMDGIRIDTGNPCGKEIDDREYRDEDDEDLVTGIFHILQIHSSLHSFVHG
jgi:hypothetical protein